VPLAPFIVIIELLIWCCADGWVDGGLAGVVVGVRHTNRPFPELARSESVPWGVWIVLVIMPVLALSSQSIEAALEAGVAPSSARDPTSLSSLLMRPGGDVRPGREPRSSHVLARMGLRSARASRDEALLDAVFLSGLPRLYVHGRFGTTRFNRV
jgi:hypothetical protein